MQWTIPWIGWHVNPIVVALFLGVLIIYKMFVKKRYNLPPGPFALPIIGNMIQMYFMKEKMYKGFMRWIQPYGPIFTVYLGTMRTVVLNNIELALEATVKKSTEFAGRPHIPTMEYVSMGYKDIVLADFGPRWRLHRRIAFSAMRNYAMGSNLEKKVHMAFDKMCAILTELKEPIILEQYISLMVYNFICGFCWGQTYEPDDAEFKRMMTIADEINTEFANGLPEDLFPFLRYFPSAKRTLLLKRVNEFFDIIWKKYIHHRDTFNPDEIRDFIDDLLLERLNAEKEEKSDILDQLTDQHLFQTITDIFGAGTDTSRFTLTYAIYYMVKYPEVQARVQQEIDKNIGKDRLPGIQDKDLLPYTEATLHETMRMDTITPVGIPHSAMVDAKIGGYDIPKGTMIIFNVWALHYDPQYWEEPDKFNPERFLEPDGTHGPKPPSFFPFSAGRRVCLGEAVAKPELLMLFACLLQKFSFSLPPGVELNTEEVPGAMANIPPSCKFLVTPR